MIFLIGLAFHAPFIAGARSDAYLAQLNQSFSHSVARNFLGVFSKRLPNAISELSKSFTPLGFIIALWGMIKLGFNNKRLFIFLLLWISVPLFFYGNIRANCPMRYLSIMTPPLTIALSFIFQSSRSSFLKYIKMTIFIIIIICLYKQIYPPANLRHHCAIPPDLAHWVAQKTEPEAKIIGCDDNLFIKYYGQRQLLPRPCGAEITEEQLFKFKENVDKVLAEGGPVYISSVNVFIYNKNYVFSDFIDKYYEGELIGRHPYEEWHLGATKLRVFNANLFKVKKKNTPTR